LEEKVLLRRSILHAVTVALLAATFAPSASAGTYSVPFCKSSRTWSTNSWTHSTTSGSQMFFWYDPSCASGQLYRRFEQIGSVPAGASDFWTFDAPDGTYISQLDMDQDGLPRTAGSGQAIYAWQEDNSRSVVAAASAGGSMSGGSYTFPLSGSKVVRLRNSLFCNDSADCAGSTPGGAYGNEQYWHSANVYLVDPSTPTFSSVSGDGWKSEPADGHDSIDYSVSDTGAGIKEVRFYVDGVLQSTKSAGCVAEQLVPCPLTYGGSFTLDTTRLSEGTHQVDLGLIDGSMNEEAKQLSITVRRAPAAIDPTTGGNPIVVSDTTWSGSNVPAVGDQLHGSSGSWSGAGLSFAYQWLRCDADGTNCVPIPGATAANYTPTSADVGHALQFCVTATNSGGSATSCSQPTPAVVASHPSSSTGGGTTANTADPVERPGEPAKQTTTNNTASSTGSADRGAPNGSPASDRVVLSALANNRASTMKVKYGKRVPITGRLVGPDGTPIANAILEVQTRTALPGASVADAGRVVTGADGRFKYVAPAGPSRVVRIAYRSHTADSSFADTSDVTLQVKAGVTIKATPKKVRNRHATMFTGRLLGKPISKRGVVVDLQVFFRHKWRTFGAPRTNRAGKYRFRYRFMAGAATWKFRARVRRESSYPYIEGYSAKTVKVKVVN
jgi:hypothetical protein